MSRSEHLGSGGPAAYFITFSCYGTRLHGDERGTVRRASNLRGTRFYGPDERLQEAERSQMTHAPFVMHADARACVVDQIGETSTIRAWTLHALNVRATHVHVVVSAPEVMPERVMNDFKAWSTKRLRKHQLVAPDQPLWSRHGSTIYVWRDDNVADVCWYVNERQGEWIPGCGAPHPSLDPTSEHQPLTVARRNTATVGLCAVCRHSRRVKSARDSVFWLCELAASDPRFAKYPRLPVLDCTGFERTSGDSGTSGL